MRRLNILQFITPAGFYGAERWVLALANNIDVNCVTCDLAVTRESEHQDLTVAEVYPQAVGEVHYLEMAGRFDLRVIRQLVDVIRRRQIDIIHTHGYKSDILGLLAAKKAGIRCVSTPHGFAGNVGFKLATFIRIGTYMLRYFDAVAPLSEELEADMSRFKVPPSKTRFIRNGVDLTEIDAATQNLPAGDSQEIFKNIGYIGQMIPRKGLPDLLAAFDRLYAKDESMTLKMLGDGSQRAELEAQAASLESASAIEFLGFRSDRLALLSQFDLFVMTSSLEGIPRCLMEAMAVGVPVVAYDIPGVDQLVKHGETGLLAPLGDVNALVDYCCQVLTNPEMARYMVTNARKLVDERFSAARMAREYEALFAQLVNPDQPEPSAKKEVS
ncbi:glycosyl transferase family 1 [Marinobacter psychrophilus]|uniref:Glycosyl transferase family 1 n=1 Tax=Marinobacter psychrophilus TaxID=330734 RepID=A0A0H4I4U0_9GAMM|nr:glycosyltransferase family 4 protein [Marinobacter psychrophilus]AKO52763.1 glycosyl transferase family 1 [Marinobacter psychrophilus]